MTTKKNNPWANCPWACCLLFFTSHLKFIFAPMHVKLGAMCRIEMLQQHSSDAKLKCFPLFIDGLERFVNRVEFTVGKFYHDHIIIAIAFNNNMIHSGFRVLIGPISHICLIKEVPEPIKLKEFRGDFFLELLIGDQGMNEAVHIISPFT